MKKLLLLSGIMLIVTSMTNINGAEPSRPGIYQMLDQLVSKNDWPTIFAFLDVMKVSVNEYTDVYNRSLLYLAILNKNLLAAKTLLEKYNANPNLKAMAHSFIFPMYPLMLACMKQDLPMIQLLLLHGANPYLKDNNNENCFEYRHAKNNPAILELLNTYPYQGD